MTWLRLALANLTLSPLTTAVNVLLMALGTASIVLLLLAGVQLQDTMSRDARGIDLVLGAQGSPVQLILSAVYHADVAPGNISLHDAERWAEDSRVANAIPMSLGDSFRGFRLVGTTTGYTELYGAKLATGELWSESMEAVLGSAVAQATGLTTEATFAGAHGLEDGGETHDDQVYRVVGVLEPTGTVLDRLVVTSLESVWDLHGEHEHAHESEHEDEGHAHEEEADHHDDRDEHAHEEVGHDEEHAADLEITAMLLTFRTPLAAATLPRDIKTEGTLQAAAPAMEVSRVLQLVGVGVTALSAFAWVLVATAALSIFAALYGSMRARRGEHAMLRCLGATRSELLIYLIVEGLLMSALGVALGFLVGHVMMELVSAWLASTRGVIMTGWLWAPGESMLLVGLIAVGGLSAIIPAVQAYRTDVARTLADA